MPRQLRPLLQGEDPRWYHHTVRTEKRYIREGALPPLHFQRRIPGISRTSLWQAWKEIRSELRNSTVRDVIDYLDYDVEPDVWIKRLLRYVSDGTYEPHPPARFTLAKSGGFKRTLTIPSPEELTLLRAACAVVHRKAHKYQQTHVYYRRTDLQKATDMAAQAARDHLANAAGTYRFTSAQSYRNWLDYEQYRKHLILEKVYRYIVITDITNFFDTVLHSEVSNAFRNFPIPSRLIGLLFFLMERLAVRADYSDSPGIGLPVDEFECSRTIANVVLFSHDRRIVEIIGESAYVRWMDDQLLGVNSRAEGLRIVATVGASLASLYLTASAKKTKVLSLKEAKTHFHLDANSRLDDIEALIKSRKKTKKALVRELAKVWRFALRHENEGEWEKIQKRGYRLAGLTNAKFLREKALRDILRVPTLTERIADYMRCSGASAEYLRFVKRALRNKAQVHEDVELLLIESLLRLEIGGTKARSILRLANQMVDDVAAGRRHFAFAAPACLLILRFGDRRNKTPLRRCFAEQINPKPAQLIRAAAAVYAGYGPKEFAEVRKAAAILLSSPLGLMVRMVRRLQNLENVPDRFKLRLRIRLDSLRGRHFVDMRTFVAARLLCLNRRKAVRAWLTEWIEEANKHKMSSFDRSLLQKLR